MHLLPILYPSLSDNATVRKDCEPGPHLIGQKVRCHDREMGDIIEFTIQDCGTSHLKGEWFEIMYEHDEGASQITAREMKVMLDDRVDEV